MRIGQEGDTRKYRKLRSTDYYEAKAAVEAETVSQEYCVICGRPIGVERKSWGGYCFECKN